MRDRILLLCLTASIAGCVSNISDVPVATQSSGYGASVFILASGSREYPGAAQGHWSAAAELAADLESAGFEPSIVLDAADAPAASPLIESIEPHGGCFSEQLLNVLSVGIIPHFGCVEYGHQFRVRCPNRDVTLVVDASFKVRSYVGWLVWPLALSRNWVYESEGPPARRPIELLYLAMKLSDALGKPGCSA